MLASISEYACHAPGRLGKGSPDKRRQDFHDWSGTHREALVADSKEEEQAAHAVTRLNLVTPS